MNKQIRYFLVANILIGWGVFYTKVVLDDKFRMDFHLPFELCNLMQMIILYAVITNKAKLLDKIMYPSILGPIAALIYPFGIADDGPFYLFYFLYYHFTLIFVGIYRLVQRKGAVIARDLTHSIAFMVVSAMIASFVNLVTDGNYMFISKSIFITPINYQLFLVLFTLACLCLFHFAIVICHSFLQSKEIKYKMKKQTSREKYKTATSIAVLFF